MPGSLARAAGGEKAECRSQKRMAFEPRATLGQRPGSNAQGTTGRCEGREHVPTRPADGVDQPGVQLVEDRCVEQDIACLRHQVVEPRPEGGLGSLGPQPGEEVAGRVRLHSERGRMERGDPSAAQRDDLVGHSGVKVRVEWAEHLSGLRRRKRQVIAVEFDQAPRLP